MIRGDRLPKVSPKKIVTVKLGGSAMDDPKVIDQLAEDIAFFSRYQISFIVVHGGGNEISKEMKSRGIEPTKVAGLRVTDDATMRVVEFVMNRMNDRICKALKSKKINPTKIIGADGTIVCRKMSPKIIEEGGAKREVDLGRVGEVEKVVPDKINKCVQEGYVPVISPYGATKEGITLNVNADTAAGSIAGVCSSEFILLTDVDGVFIKTPRGQTIVKSLTAGEINGLIANGTIRDGMLPKVESCMHALESGVKSAVIVNGLSDHPLRAVLSEAGNGTTITN